MSDDLIDMLDDALDEDLTELVKKIEQRQKKMGAVLKKHIRETNQVVRKLKTSIEILSQKSVNVTQSSTSVDGDVGKIQNIDGEGNRIDG